MGVIDIKTRNGAASDLDKIGCMRLRDIWFAEYEPVSDQWHMAPVTQMIATNYVRHFKQKDTKGYFPVFYGPKWLVDEFIDEEIRKRESKQ